MGTDVLSKLAEDVARDIDKEMVGTPEDIAIEAEIASVEDIMLQTSGAYAECTGDDGEVIRAFRIGSSWTVQLVNQYIPVDVVFDNAHDAAKTFVELRHEYKIGGEDG